MTTPPIDKDAAHRHFSAACFNEAWTLLDMTSRTPEQDLQLLATAYASLYHWQQRADCTAKQRSVGCWQVSRAHAVLKQGAEARRLAQLSLHYSEGLPAFYRGYAHEGLARAAALLGDAADRDRQLGLARQCLASIDDAEERSMLEADLDSMPAA